MFYVPNSRVISHSGAVIAKSKREPSLYLQAGLGQELVKQFIGVHEKQLKQVGDVFLRSSCTLIDVR